MANDGRTRKVGEGSRAFAARICWLDFGPDRSKQKIADKLGLKYSTISNWHFKWNWEESTIQWEEFLANAQKKIATKLLEQDSVKWAARRIEAREAEYQMSLLMRKRAMEMLSFPITEQRVLTVDDTGRPLTIEIKPGKWNYGNLPALADIASKLWRASAGVETDELEEAEAKGSEKTLESRIAKAQADLDALIEKSRLASATVEEFNMVAKELPKWVEINYEIPEGSLTPPKLIETSLPEISPIQEEIHVDGELLEQ